VGQLPFKYLGVMVNNKHMSSSYVAYVYQKVEKKLPTWQSVSLSSGGKSVLIQSSLSSIPIYTMGSIYCKMKSIKKWTRLERISSGMGLS
jgi:hypothetical protein